MQRGVKILTNIKLKEQQLTILQMKIRNTKLIHIRTYLSVLELTWVLFNTGQEGEVQKISFYK